VEKQPAGAQNLGRNTQFGTYRAAGFPTVDFDEFHSVELPRRLREGKSEEVAWDVEGAAPLAILLRDHDGAVVRADREDRSRGYSFVCRNGVVEVVPGVVEDAATILEIVDSESWVDYLHEFRTRAGLLYSKAVRFVRGNRPSPPSMPIRESSS
jgi:hypothetical protein